MFVFLLIFYATCAIFHAIDTRRNGKWVGKWLKKSNKKCSCIHLRNMVARRVSFLTGGIQSSPLQYNTWYGHFPVDCKRTFFYPIFGKEERKKKKKNKPLKFNGYAVKHIARARPNHLSVYSIENLSVGWWAFHTSFLHVMFFFSFVRLFIRLLGVHWKFFTKQANI